MKLEHFDVVWNKTNKFGVEGQELSKPQLEQKFKKDMKHTRVLL